MLKQVISATALIAVGASGAHAADWYTGSPMNSRPAGAHNPMASIDMSFSMAGASLGGALVGTLAPFGGLEEDGMRFRMIGVLGGYKYDSTALGVGEVTGNQVGTSLLLGHEWIVNKTKFAVYGGVDLLNNKLDKADPNNDTEGGRVGFRAGLDFYSNPTPTTMAAGTLTFTTVNSGYYGRLRGGIAVKGQMYIGPEGLVLGDSFFTQWRIGMHLSGIEFGPVQFGISGGYASDSTRGGGGYGILDTRITF